MTVIKPFSGPVSGIAPVDANAVRGNDNALVTALNTIAGLAGTVAYVPGGTSAPDARLGWTMVLTVTDNVGTLVALPTTLSSGGPYALHVVNTSGGALTGITFPATYHFATAFAAPANGRRQIYSFSSPDGVSLYETSRSGDVA